MSAMSELHLQIQELIEQDLTGCEIAERLNIDVDIVYDVMDSMEEPIDCDDSDDGYALASAGFGTDEDYGGYDEW